jgi:outer membrane protein assembly factor BamB
MGSVHTSPVLYKDSIYVGSYNGDVYSLNSTTGRMEWQFVEGTPIVGSPAVQNETVYVGSYGGSVYALNSLNGTAEWNVSVNNSVSKSSPMVSGETLYIGTGGISAPSGSLYALNARNGTADWSLKTDDWVWSSPLLSDDRLFFTSHKSVYMIEGNSSSTEQEPRVTYNPKLGNHSTVNSSQTSGTVSEGRTDPNSTSTGYNTLDPLPNNQPVVPTVIAALLIAPILILVSSVAFERMFE